MKARKLHIFIVLLCTCIQLTAFSQTIIGRQRVDQFPVNQWGGMTYGLTWLPTDYFTSNTRYPLIIFLHGAGETGTTVGSLNNLLTQAIPMKIAQGWDPVAVNPVDGQTYQFIVVSPQAPGWSYGYPAIQFILNDVISKYRVDTTRIYFTGLSAGGAGTWGSVTNGYNMAKRVAAVVPVSAAGTNTPAEANELQYVGGSYGVKVWTICGTQDSFWPSTVNFTNTINNANPAPLEPVVYSGLPAGHTGAAWNTAYDPNWRNNAHNLNVYEWLLKHKRPAAAVAPVANAGPDQNVALPTNQITLNGIGTAGGGNQIVSYSWTKYSGQSCTIDAPNSATTTISGLLQGTYVFRLVVRDNQGNTAVDDVTVNVLPSSSFTTIPALIQAENWYLMSGVQTENTADAGGGVNVAYIDNGDWMDYNIRAVSAGSFTLRLRVAAASGGGQLQVRRSDGSVLSTVNIPNTGGWQTWQTLTTTVNLPAGNQTIRIVSTAATGWNLNWIEFTGATANSAPTAHAGNDQTITLPTNSVTLNGTGTDPDGTIASYNWAKINGPASFTIANPSSAQTTVNGLSQGTYRFQLTVTDNQGATATDTVVVTVNPAPNNPPVANAGADININLPLNVVTLNGSGTDSDGSITGYQWTKLSGPVAVIVTPNAAQSLVTGLGEGLYAFRLTVTDNNGASDSDTVLVNVGPAPNVAPVADAGANQTINLPLNSVILSGSGTDSDGSIAAYAWNKISGPSQYTIVSPAQASTAVNNLVQGIYSFELTVTDDDGASGKDTVMITVNAPLPNQAPVANAGSDQTITLPVNAATLNGSGTDSDGTIASYQWTKVNGPLSYNIASPNAQTTAVNNLIEGSYRFVLTVTDDDGATDSDTVVITVNPAPNVPPVANAGADQAITLPVDSVVLNGSGTDTDGSVTAYAWNKISGPSSYTVLSPSEAQTLVKNLTAGVYQFELTITDNNGATHSDVVVITVNNAVNQAPLADAGTDLQISLPVDSVNLNGMGSDADGTIASYNWTKISGPASFIIVSATQAQTLVKNLVEGTYQFELTVTDNNGATAKDSVTVTVNPAPNQAPSVNAGNDQQISLPVNSVTLDGTAADADGSIVSWQWTKITGPASFTIVSANQPQTLVNDLTEGSYSFVLAVTDDDGATATDTVYVTVNPAPTAPNAAPVADAGADQAVTLPLNSVTLTGSGTDSDGTVSAFAWTKISGPSSFTIADPSQAQTNVNGLVAGIYEFELAVTDDDGATAKDTVRVTVNPAPNSAPLANAGTDQTITLPVDSVMLNGSGTDSDGTIASYLWTKLSGPASFVIANATDAQTPVTGLTQGVYSFVLTVTDDQGATDNDTVLVTVNAPANQPPVANAGNDMSITLPTNSVNLNGMGSDADGTIAAYQWSKISGPPQFNIVSPNTQNTTVSNLVQGVYEFMLTVTDDDGATDSDTVKVTVGACGGVRKVVIPWSDGGRYFSGKPSNQNYFACNPGDTLVLRASNNTWSYFSIEDFHGTEACPIVIINEGGQVKMTKGMDIKHSSHIKVTGSGSNDNYGFYIHNPAATDNNGVAIAITGRCRYIEVEKIFVHKKTYGSWIKEDGSCLDSLNYPNWWMDNIKMHDCKFVNMGQSAIYAGNTAPTGTRPVVCNGVTTYPIPMRLSNIQIYNNIVDSCMRSGIQLGGADSGYNAIYNNIITRCGYEMNQQQGTGISIGGMTRNCHVYNNTIKSTFLYGIMCLGVGTNYIENNTIDSSGFLNGVPNMQSMANGIFVDTRQTIPFDSAKVIIQNNKIGRSVSPHDHDIFLNKTYPTYAVGNKICGNTKLDGATPAKYYVQQGINYTTCLPVPPGNIPPIANAGVDQVITLPTNSGILYGSMMELDGVVWFVNWTKISGPAQHTISPPNQPYTWFSNLVQGVYEFEIKVTDNQGGIGRDTVKITVLPAPPNNLPVANAGPDKVVNLPGDLQLTGSGTDSDGTITAYLWTKVAGPSQYMIVSPNQAQTTVTSLVAGTYQFELRVTDNLGGIDRDTMTVVVNPAPNQPPVANAGNDLAITLPTNSVTLNGSATDVDGTITSWQWLKISGPTSFSIVSANQAQTLVNNLVEGTYQFLLTVTDDDGATDTDTVRVIVNPVPTVPNVPPTANAGSDQTIVLPTNSVTLAGSGMDSDGSIIAYKWTKISGPIWFTIVSSNQAQTQVTGLVQGTYRFELMVTDNQGATGKDTVTVNVIPNLAPVASAGPDKVITLPVNSVTVAGSGSDADGSIASYQWTRISGPLAYQISDPNSAQTAMQNLVAGTYEFELTVTDNFGATGKDTMTILVNPPVNFMPVAYAGADTTIMLPTNSLVLMGSGTDADGFITSYSWSKIAGPSQFNIVSPAQAQTMVTNLVDGLYKFELKVTDNQGAVDRDTVIVIVSPDTRRLSTAMLYPVPAKNTINIKFDAITHRNLTEIRIYDTRGVLVHREEFLRTQQVAIKQIDISRLVPGVYVVQVNADVNQLVSLKFVKEN